MFAFSAKVDQDQDAQQTRGGYDFAIIFYLLQWQNEMFPWKRP